MTISTREGALLEASPLARFKYCFESDPSSTPIGGKDSRSDDEILIACAEAILIGEGEDSLSKDETSFIESLLERRRSDRSKPNNERQRQ